MKKGDYEYNEMMNKLGVDEEIFILRAQDVLAPMAIEYWAELAAKLRVKPEKILKAYRCSTAMQQYSPRKVPD